MVQVNKYDFTAKTRKSSYFSHKNLYSGILCLKYVLF
jgi:hypothetical protein